MSSKRLPQYRGPLDAHQIASGINAAQRNADRLAEDSKLMFEAGSYASAAALAILSIEESGKTSILRRLAAETSAKEIKAIWNEYRSHTKKNYMANFVELVLDGARQLEDFGPLFAPDSAWPTLIDQVKQIALYSDCLGNAHWSEPEQVIDEALAKSLLINAQAAATTKEVSTREIELWVQHVCPSLSLGVSASKSALIDWYAALQSEGLAPLGDNPMASFVQN